MQLASKNFQLCIAKRIMSSNDTSNLTDEALNSKNANGPLLTFIAPLTIVGFINIALSMLRYYQNSLPQSCHNKFQQYYLGIKKCFHI